MPGWAQDATANKTEKSCILGELGSYTINTDIRQAVMGAVKNATNDLREEVWSTPAKVRTLALTLSEMRF